MRGAQRHQAGFTLLELLVVIALLGILFAIGASGLFAYRTSVALDDALSSVSQAFSSAAQATRTSSRVSTISFDTTARSVKVMNNGNVVVNKALQLDSLSVTCRQTCTALSFDLTAPGGELPQDLSFTLSLNGKSKTFKVVGPSAMEVR